MLNADLADKFGNLLLRCTSLTINRNQKYPSFLKGDHKRFHTADSENLINALQDLPGMLRNFLSISDVYV